MSDSFRIAIIGSGPSGLSCAAHAAELGIPHVLLEAEEHPSHTIRRYQKGKHVMAEPSVLPLRSPLSFTAGTRESVLDKWTTELSQYGVNIRGQARVASITGSKGDFEIRTARGDVCRAEHVVLCIGLQGNIRLLGVPGEDAPIVQYQLDDPDEYSNETIVVVGAGDAGIENALALARNNRVILINRLDEFPRVQQGNLDLVLGAIREGTIECRYGTTAVRVDAMPTRDKRGCFVAQTPSGLESIPCDRVIARLGATPPRRLVESFGVVFPSKDPTAIPQLSATYESNVPGLYIIGALGGYPLIKQAMNQGYEVVEYIRGNPVEPADEPLLKAKFRDFAGAATVSEALALVQRNVPLFASLTTLQLREFMLSSDVLSPREGEVIFRKNDYTNSFFSIVDGEVLVETPGSGDDGHVTLARGEFFGELGLISGRRRTATVRAGDRCLLIETSRRSMLKLVSNIESVRQQIDQMFLRRAVSAVFGPSLSGVAVDELIQGAAVKTFAADEVLFKEGDEPDGLHLIRRGSVMITRQIGMKEVVLSYVAAGNYVGEMALLSDARRNATVRASVKTETIVLQVGVLREILNRNAALRRELEAIVLERLSERAVRESEPESGNLIGFLMKQGLGEATDVLLIDESLCIRCDNCEKACAESHDGTSRLNRQAGPTYANVHVPTSCRHCENPHCMKDCPPDAIHRDSEGEVLIDDTCIGCGNCQRNCPYGVIQMAPASAPRFRPSLFAWLLTGATAEPGKQRRAQSKDDRKKAVKCDMCTNISGGPACVRACPTGAAIRVTSEEFLDYAGN